MKTLSPFRAVFLAIFLFAANMACSSFCLASQPAEGVIVLRNGNILRGTVEQHDEHYIVQLSNGSLQIPEQQVEMVCPNIEEAYQRRRGARVGSTADSHLKLAAWCLRHDLFGHAEEELQEAQTTDSKHPKLARLQRQLKLSLWMEQRKKKKKHLAQNASPPRAPLDPAAIEKAPKWARALFVRQIQPLMVHSCAAGGCHQPGPNSELLPGSEAGFHLNRLAIEGVGHPETTLRNLAATLEQIDWQATDQSNLLRRAREAHGLKNASTPLPPHKLKVLQGWVEQLAEAHRMEADLKTRLLVARLPSESKLQLVSPQKTPEPTPSHVVTASYEKAVDPFDPSVFNRRHAKTSKEKDPEPQPLDAELIPFPPTD